MNGIAKPLHQIVGVLICAAPRRLSERLKSRLRLFLLPVALRLYFAPARLLGMLGILIEAVVGHVALQSVHIHQDKARSVLR